MIKFALALQTPTIDMVITPKDSAGNTDRFRVEFKRYNLEESKKKLDDYAKLGEKLSDFLKANKDLSESEIEARKDDLQALLDDYNEQLKQFVKAEIVSFKDIKCRDNTGKVVRTIKNTSTEGEDLEQWGVAENCTPAWFEFFWSSNPYKVAIEQGMTAAIRNTE